MPLQIGKFIRSFDSSLWFNSSQSKSTVEDIAVKQDKESVLQYAAKFESLKAQLESYDEQILLMKFILSLNDDFIEPVFMQYPKTV